MLTFLPTNARMAMCRRLICVIFLIIIHVCKPHTSRRSSTDFRVALAGGLAGATGTVILHPVDTAKVRSVVTSHPSPLSLSQSNNFVNVISPSPPSHPSQTMRQKNPATIPSVGAALARMFKPPPSYKLNISPRTLGRVYRGVIPAALGAIPSSALYFGSYEGVKRRLSLKVEESGRGGGMDNRLCRVAVHGVR